MDIFPFSSKVHDKCITNPLQTKQTERKTTRRSTDILPLEHSNTNPPSLPYSIERQGYDSQTRHAHDSCLQGTEAAVSRGSKEWPERLASLPFVLRARTRLSRKVLAYLRARVARGCSWGHSAGWHPWLEENGEFATRKEEGGLRSF